MYRYFISFSHIINGVVAFGNAVFETNTQITDCNSTESSMDWIELIQEYIEKNQHIKNVVIISFCLIG